PRSRPARPVPAASATRAAALREHRERTRQASRRQGSTWAWGVWGEAAIVGPGSRMDKVSSAGTGMNRPIRHSFPPPPFGHTAAMPMSPTSKAFLQIHFCVVLWGFTAILGKLITLPALPLVWARMLLVVVALALLPKVWRGLRAMPPRLFWAYAGVGVL